MKTKTFLSAMFFSSLTYTSVFAQTHNEQKENKWQIGVLLNTVEPIQTEGGFDFNQRFLHLGHRKDKSYSTGLNISYKVQENFSLRLSAKITEYNIEETADTREVTDVGLTPSSNYGLYFVKAKSSVINISPGVLWNLKYKIINPYAGFQLSYKYYNKVIGNVHDEVYERATNNFLSSDNQAIKEGGGFALGVGPFIGLSIKAYRGLSVGAEFSSAFYYYKLGSSNYENIVTTVPYVPSTPSYTITSPKSDTNEGANFSNIITSIIISINF